MKKLQVLILVVFLFAGGPVLLAQTVVKAELHGGHVVSPTGGVASAATADVTYNVYSDRIEFSIRLRQFGTDVTQIHVYLAADGLAGPIILNMYDRAVHGPIPDVETLDGGVFRGFLTEENARITNDLRMRGIRNFSDIRAALLNPAGLTNTTVRTTGAPFGEIRGTNRPALP